MKISIQDRIYSNIVFRNQYYPAKPILYFYLHHSNRLKRYVVAFVGVLKYGSLGSIFKLRY